MTSNRIGKEKEIGLKEKKEIPELCKNIRKTGLGEGRGVGGGQTKVETQKGTLYASLDHRVALFLTMNFKLVPAFIALGHENLEMGKSLCKHGQPFFISLVARKK
ncbi:hypothetical protein CEXT_248561 [Caerostris extrusa]|uniref:Uncharacterized protein n=1 Tax=Caerostris extrusa TaxID=172846 RepID=A0AAV4SEQ2_CAEEX|nr:hypothetical protein CEXT_248561 [Caerostris extrusa]